MAKKIFDDNGNFEVKDGYVQIPDFIWEQIKELLTETLKGIDDKTD